MSVTVDVQGLNECLMAVHGLDKRTRAAIASATSRSLIAGRTAISKGVRSQYSVKAGTVKGAMKLQKASDKLSGEIRISGRTLDLMEFSPRISRRGMVSVRIKKSRKRLPHSFFVATGKAGLYHRMGKARLPIEREYTLSVPQMAGNTVVAEQVSNRMREVFEERLAHALEYGNGRNYE